jgi:hypothetical protein
MIPTVGLKLVGVNIYENIKGQPYFNSRNFLWVLFGFACHTLTLGFSEFSRLICIPMSHLILFNIGFDHTKSVTIW